LDRIAPSVSDLAWGHKYFSLLFPEKLDDYHVADLQRFYLLKIMLLPPEGRGRYLCTGRFVAVAAEVDFAMNHLTTVLNLVNLANGKKHRYWRVGTSDGNKPRNRWSLMRNGNCVAVGWPDVGDLSGLDGSKESREKLRGLMAEKYPSVASQVGNATGQLFTFVRTIQKGDLVLAADGATVLGIARVEGDYHYDASSDFPHRRDVVWLATEEWKMPNPEGLQTTVREVKKYPENILEVTRRGYCQLNHQANEDGAVVG
jgi:5-methylcytosine-specific restriction protein B